MARKKDENEFTDTTVNRAALGLRTHAVNDVGPTPTSVAPTKAPVVYRNRDGSITDVPFDGNSVPVGTDFQPPTRQNTGPVAHPQVSRVRYSTPRPAAEANIADFSQLPAGATTNAELQNQFSRGIGGPTTNDVPEPVTVAKGLRRPNVPGTAPYIIEKFENEIAAAGTQEVPGHTPARIAEYQAALKQRAGIKEPTPANMFQGIPGHDVPDMLSNPVQTPLRIAGTAVEAAGNLDRSLQENKSAPLWMRAVSKAGADLAPKVTGALHGAADKVRDFGESQRQAMKDYLGDTPDRSGPYDSSSSPTGAPREPVSLLRGQADPNATFSLQGADYVPSYAKGEQVSPLRQPPVKNSKGQTVLPDGSILLDHTTVDASTFNEDGTANNGIGSPGPRFSGGGPTSVQLGYNPSQSAPVDSLARPGSISGRRGSRLELPAGEVVNLGNDRYARKSVRELSRSGGPVRQNFTINHAGPFAGYDGPITNQTLKHFADQKRAKMVSAAANGGNILRQISAAQGRAKRAYNKAVDAGMSVKVARDLANVEMEGIKDLVDARGDTLDAQGYADRTAAQREATEASERLGYAQIEDKFAKETATAQGRKDAADEKLTQERRDKFYEWMHSDINDDGEAFFNPVDAARYDALFGFNERNLTKSQAYAAKPLLEMVKAYEAQHKEQITDLRDLFGGGKVKRLPRGGIAFESSGVDTDIPYGEMFKNNVPLGDILAETFDQFPLIGDADWIRFANGDVMRLNAVGLSADQKNAYLRSREGSGAGENFTTPVTRAEFNVDQEGEEGLSEEEMEEFYRRRKLRR